MRPVVNVVGLCGVLVIVRDLARSACRKLSSGKSISLEELFVVSVSGCVALVQ